MGMPLLQVQLARLSACATAPAVARALAAIACEARGTVAAGVFLRDYAGERLVLTGSAPDAPSPDGEAGEIFLPPDNLEDPLCYCLHTGNSAQFSLSCGLPASLKLLPRALSRSVASVQVFPLARPGMAMLGGVIVGYDASSAHQPASFACLCLHAAALLQLAGETLRGDYAEQALQEEVRRGKKAGAVVPALRSAPCGAKAGEGELFIGDSPAARHVRQAIAQAAQTSLPVIITGETGTGKSYMARLIHEVGHRRGSPFVEINCGALPADLLESELFGHVKGAFSGAAAHHKGLFRSAEGGTILLDEIGEMPPALQVALLQVLQDHKVRPVGGTTAYPVDIRVIAATNCDVDEAIRAGTFRKDLYHRLAVLKIHLPPLRERREDIPVLAAHFLASCARKYGRSSLLFSPEAQLSLLGHSYPGNVRELAGMVERAVSLAPPESVELGSDFLASGAGVRPPCISLAEYRDMQEAWFIDQACKLYDGNVQACARALGVHPRTIYRRLEKWGAARSQGGRG